VRGSFPKTQEEVNQCAYIGLTQQRQGLHGICDVSKNGLGCMLMQDERVMAYALQ